MCLQAAGKAAVYVSVHTWVTDQRHHLKLIINRTKERGCWCEVYRFQTNARHTWSARQHRWFIHTSQVEVSQTGNNWGQNDLLPPKSTQFILMSKWKTLHKLFLMYLVHKNGCFKYKKMSQQFFFISTVKKDEKQSLFIPNWKKGYHFTSI